MPTVFPTLLLLCLFRAAVAAFSEQDLAGLFTLKHGIDAGPNSPVQRCGDLLRFSASGTTILPDDISLDKKVCSGGSLLLSKNPPSGGTGFVRFFFKNRASVGDFFAGSLSDRLVCGGKAFGAGGTFFVFVRPDLDVRITWDDVAGENVPLEDASQSQTFTFRRNVAYVIINNRCLFTRDDSADDKACFPADASVRLREGRDVPMARLRTGDEVLVGNGSYSPVFAWTHRDASATADAYVAIDVGLDRRLTLTKGHFVYVGDRVVRAGSVRVGDVMTDASGKRLLVQAVDLVQASGLYNPQTLQGDIVVDGVLVSTYTTSVERTQAHALLAPFRAAFHCGAKWLGEMLLRGLERSFFTGEA